MKKLFFFVLLPTLFSFQPLNAFTPPSPGESFIYPSPSIGNYAYLSFSMAGSGQSHLLIYNEAASLVMDDQESFSAGIQKIRLNNYLFANGAYVYRLYLTYDSRTSEKLSGKFSVIHK